MRRALCGERAWWMEQGFSASVAPGRGGGEAQVTNFYLLKALPALSSASA